MRVLFYPFSCNYIFLYHVAENEDTLCDTWRLLLRVNVNEVVYASVWPTQSPDFSAAAAAKRKIAIIQEAECNNDKNMANCSQKTRAETQYRVSLSFLYILWLLGYLWSLKCRNTDDYTQPFLV